ncbi:hypothetical protein BJV78DRAFT_1279575 [Lactifluus subvellereus]|nr:hypothetical protein BJV78DRAFT_1279575 [Lactifluus subvellereus]
MSAIDVQLPTDDRHRSPSIPYPRIASSPRGLPCSLLSDPSLYNVPDPLAGPSTFGTSSPLCSYPPASTRISLVSVLQEPRILANFLRYTLWHDFRSLALTSTACRNVLQHPELRDAVLSAYVPGYQYCLRYADLHPSADIDIQLNDLNDFIISQQLPLHLYPTHALATLSSRDKIPVLEKKTQKYMTLCQAHSRMVLLLQALIHSALSPVSEELEDPSLRYRSISQEGARELVFPAPLSFISNHVESKSHAAQQPIRERVRFFSLPQTSARSRRTSGGQLPKRSLSLKSFSILGKNKVPPPPPSTEPLGLKLYSGSWRGRKCAPVVSGSASEDDGILFRRPNRNLASTTASSLSSTDNSQGSRSPHPPRLAGSVPMPPAPHAPHDMRAATSRLRAPILRVYFPCSELDHGAIAACEGQLDDAGLWHHLSVGDVVCNLGYLPPADRLGSSTGDLSSGGKYSQESWMIFDGTGLVPYTPSAVLPLSEPLSLPSPLYYAHIARPPFNPRFIAVLPHEEPELSLAFLPGMVPSPHSPNGFARVKKYVWLARLGPHVRPGLGEGWHGEWILEGGGTKEGRQSLLDALCGNASSKREWELIMEKSTTTRIWLRLVSTTPPSDSESP